MQRVGPDRPQIALGIGGKDGEAGVLLEARHEVDGGILPEVHFARLEGGGRGGLVGDVAPLDPVHVNELGARPPARSLLARHVVPVGEVHHLVAGLPLVLDELEGAGPGEVLDLLVGVGDGHPRRHHDAGAGRGLAQRLEDETEGRLELEDEGLLVHRRELAE